MLKLTVTCFSLLLIQQSSMETDGRGMRRHSSPSLSPKVCYLITQYVRVSLCNTLQGGHPTSCYGSRGTYGRPQYAGGSYRSNSHKDYDYRRSPREHSEDDCTCTASSQHHHNHPFKHQLSAHNNDINDLRKRKTTSICTADGTPPSEPAEPLHSRNERHASDSDSSKPCKPCTITSTPPHNNKRVRSSDDESGYEILGDTRHESAYVNGKSGYKPGTRIYSRSGRSEHAEAAWDEQGRGRYDDGRSWDIQADPGFNSSVLCRKKLWVGALPSNITCEEIRKYFEIYGKLIYVMVSTATYVNISVLTINSRYPQRATLL